jgi:hypothetical protein
MSTSRKCYLRSVSIQEVYTDNANHVLLVLNVSPSTLNLKFISIIKSHYLHNTLKPIFERGEAITIQRCEPEEYYLYQLYT